MDNRSTVNELFQFIATELGFQVVLGTNNLCNIQRKSTGEEIIIELPHNNDMLYIYGIVGEVPFENREKFFEFILKLNLHGNGTGYGNLGIDVKTNKLILSRLFSIENLDEEYLLRVMNEFFSTTSNLKEKLSRFLQIQPSGKDVAFEGEFMSPNLNFVI